MEQNVTYAFGPFRLETRTQFLYHEGENVRLQPKVYRLLLYFLQHPGRLISREELFEGVWRGMIVEDASLRQAVNALRKALLDDSKTPSYILTVCKRGYVFSLKSRTSAQFKRRVCPTSQKPNIPIPDGNMMSHWSSCSKRLNKPPSATGA